MKTKIVIEHNNEYIEIPVPLKEWKAIYDVLWLPPMSKRELKESIKLNKFEKEISSFHHKVEWMIHDILNEGRVYSMNTKKYHITLKGEKGKTIQQKGGFKLLKKRHYVVKKPKWKKKDGML